MLIFLLTQMKLAFIDYAILALYFVFVLGIGWRLRKKISTSGDFLTSGHSVPVWITSLAFLAANLGAQELVGMSGNGAKYGIITSHFYWVGAVPAMIFVGLFMMPFYYGSRARSVPEYLRMRFDEKTRALNALSFAGMTIFSSGISMHALGLLLNLVLGWSYTTSVLVSAAIVLAYTFLGGLTSAIYNEVLQFFLIVMGFSPLAIMAVLKAGDIARIESAIHWDLKWKEDINDDDRRMMDKSKEDYLKMLQRAPSKVSAFNLAPIAPSDTDRTRVFFHLLTTEGDKISSSFEMIQLEGQWKPVLAMGWHYPKDPSSFFTSPMFGPTIDLERH